MLRETELLLRIISSGLLVITLKWNFFFLVPVVDTGPNQNAMNHCLIQTLECFGGQSCCNPQYSS